MSKEKRIHLADGRDIALMDQGKTDGVPVIYLHGTPGANKDHAQHEAFYRAQGIRMVSVNRPGTGASSYSEGWNALSFADDLKQVLDSLGIERATVIGFSSGGLHACAFAHQYSECVSRLGLLGSVGPFDIEALGDKRNEATKMFHDAARDNPEALLSQLVPITTPKALSSLVDTLVSPEDLEIFAQPDIATQQLLSYQDVIEQGLDKLVHEIAIINSPWGFNVSGIRSETLIWHGTADINIPIECSEYLAETIPNARASYLEGAGHYFSFEQWPELLGQIVAN